MSQEILDQIRVGLDLQIKDAIERNDVPQEYVQQVTQSYLLLKILEKLDRLDGRLANIYTELRMIHLNEGKKE